jgi:hypothetical protein
MATLLRAKTNVYRLKCFIPLLGYSNGKEEILLLFSFVSIKDGSEIRFLKDKLFSSATRWKQYTAQRSNPHQR